MDKNIKQMAVSILAAAMVFTGTITGSVRTASAETADYTAKLTFSDSGIAETVAGSGYSISGTTLSITSAGTYDITGSCSDGSISVAKGLTDVTLLLDDLTLASETTAPVVVKKGASVNMHLDGTSTLTDNESDSSLSDYEGAAIKVKSGSTVTFCGDGNLNVVANSKNGIKGGSTAALIFNQSGKVKVSGNYSGYATSAGAVNNGIAADGSVVINQGSFDIDAANDGIKSCPDATDATEGTTVDTESAGTVTINGGSFDIDVDGDAIQADTDLTINNGTFDIKTMNGYGTSGTKYKTNGNTSSSYTFDPDTMSCKGLKASGDRAEEVGTSPALTVNGGSFTIDSADDAVHSDAFATVTGGTFDISSGDDGMHADTSLILGTEGSVASRDPYVSIDYSYEGLEGGTVYMYQGVYSVKASDDGVNAAGGTDSSGAEAGGGGFNPGGGFGPGGSPGSGRATTSASSSSDYNIYINGGSLYVNCDGDGLDSNGGLYLTGGVQEVFSQSSGDNSAIDADGTISINGATVFTAGTQPQMDPVRDSWFGNSQRYKTYSSSLSSGKIVNATLNSSVLYSVKLPKAASYFMYSAPSLSGTPAIAAASSLTSCKGGSHSHTWNSGKTSGSTTTYTCTGCSATETQTVAITVSLDACDHSVEFIESDDESQDEGYTVTFAGDAGVKSITVYETQDYTGASESVSASGMTVSRNSKSGDPDSTGDGQINFTVVLNDGYSLSAVTATTGTYKNIKDLSETDGITNTYRITKITADTTITITTEASSSDDETGYDSSDDSGDDTGSSIGNDSSTETGETEDSTTDSGSINTDSGSTAVTVSAGDVYTVSGNTYTVTAASGSSAGTVTLKSAKNAGTVKVPAAITLADGNTYNVTAIAARAFKGSKIRTVYIGANVSKIAKNCFAGSKATKIVVKSKKLKKAGVKGSLRSSKVTTVKVKVGSSKLNKTYVKKYKKIFTKANAGRKVSVK